VSRPSVAVPHRVARPDVVTRAGESILRIRHRDHVTGLKPLAAAACRHVDQQASGHHLREGIDAEPAGAVILDDVGKEEPVVGTLAHLQVIEPVHVGAHLLSGGDLLDDPVDAVAA